MSLFGAIASDADVSTFGANLLSTVTGIDGTVAADTTLFTPTASQNAIITMVIVRLTTVAGFVTAPTIGMGQNAGSDNVITPVPLTNLDTFREIFYMVPIGAYRLIIGASGDVFKAGIDVGAVATTYTMTIYTFGLLTT